MCVHPYTYRPLREVCVLDCSKIKVLIGLAKELCVKKTVETTVGVTGNKSENLYLPEALSFIYAISVGPRII